MAFQIRAEQPHDIAAIGAVNCEAFGHAKTAQLIETLRADGALTVSLVAVQDGAIVGHVAFSPMTIKNGDATINTIGLAPLAVKPGLQGQGIGNALVKAGIEAVRQAGWSSLIVLGSPQYYGRFGFGPAAAHGITWEQKDAGAAFQVMELQPGALNKQAKGIAAYHPAFKNT